jgi:hypothetical protein
MAESSARERERERARRGGFVLLATAQLAMRHHELVAENSSSLRRLDWSCATELVAEDLSSCDGSIGHAPPRARRGGFILQRQIDWSCATELVAEDSSSLRQIG